MKAPINDLQLSLFMYLKAYFQQIQSIFEDWLKLIKHYLRAAKDIWLNA